MVDSELEEGLTWLTMCSFCTELGLTVSVYGFPGHGIGGEAAVSSFYEMVIVGSTCPEIHALLSHRILV